MPWKVQMEDAATEPMADGASQDYRSPTAAVVYRPLRLPLHHHLERRGRVCSLSHRVTADLRVISRAHCQTLLLVVLLYSGHAKAEK